MRMSAEGSFCGVGVSRAELLFRVQGGESEKVEVRSDQMSDRQGENKANHGSHWSRAVLVR